MVLAVLATPSHNDISTRSQSWTRSLLTFCQCPVNVSGGGGCPAAAMAALAP